MIVPSEDVTRLLNPFLIVYWCSKCIFYIPHSTCFLTSLVVVWREGSLCQQVYKGASGLPEWTIVIWEPFHHHGMSTNLRTFNVPVTMHSAFTNVSPDSRLPQKLRHLDFTFLKKEAYCTAHLFCLTFQLVALAQCWEMASFNLWHFFGLQTWTEMGICRHRINLYLTALMTRTPNFITRNYLM